MQFRSFEPYSLPLPERHQVLLSTIAPRPICFASTVDAEGRPNLAPFSFFNVFSSNPPVVVFSPALAGRDAKAKDTLLNVREVPEVVINTVSYAMVQQMSLASTAYPRGVNEFEKSGFTALASETVRPFRVAESPAQLECVVREIKSLGEGGGAGNLIIAEVRYIHLREDIFGSNGRIDPQRIDLVSRMGYNYYNRASGQAVFEVEKPLARLGIGVDALPETIRLSRVLRGNHLGQLGNTESLPTPEEIEAVKREPAVQALLGESDAVLRREKLQEHAAAALDAGKTAYAFCVLMLDVV